MVYATDLTVVVVAPYLETNVYQHKILVSGVSESMDVLHRFFIQFTEGKKVALQDVLLNTDLSISIAARHQRINVHLHLILSFRFSESMFGFHQF